MKSLPLIVILFFVSLLPAMAWEHGHRHSGSDNPYTVSASSRSYNYVFTWNRTTVKMWKPVSRDASKPSKSVYKSISKPSSPALSYCEPIKKIKELKKLKPEKQSPPPKKKVKKPKEKEEKKRETPPPSPPAPEKEPEPHTVPDSGSTLLLAGLGIGLLLLWNHAPRLKRARVRRRR